MKHELFAIFVGFHVCIQIVLPLCDILSQEECVEEHCICLIVFPMSFTGVGACCVRTLDRL